jgi:hypothetical protein
VFLLETFDTCGWGTTSNQKIIGLFTTKEKAQEWGVVKLGINLDNEGYQYSVKEVSIIN